MKKSSLKMLLSSGYIKQVAGSSLKGGNNGNGNGHGSGGNGNGNNGNGNGNNSYDYYHFNAEGYIPPPA